MKFTHLAAVAALVASAAADWEIFSPSSDVWWVAKSINTLSWSCKDPVAVAHPTFTVLVANSDPKVLTSPIAIIGIQNNFDCSKTITADMLNAAPGTGYTIQFANTLNATDIFVSSSPFEIKPLGSAYPTATPGISTSSPSATGSGANAATTSSTTSDNSKGNGAMGMGVKAAGVVGAVAGVLGLVM
ncbi:hypothetical protein C0995_006326 [Termitomyces sp. Mi166|nr:hypothetical protein C0995_006326 [Termitomyces sp. Mi166\